MKAFELENPIMTKIKTVVDQWKTDNNISDSIKYLDFEPSEQMIDSIKNDGVICVYVRGITFPTGSNTATFTAYNKLTIDCYGFGRPLKNDSDDWEPSIREAQNRGEILTSLSYNAIMDRTEDILNFNTDIDIEEKTPVSVDKFSPIGTIGSNRGVCFYRTIFDLRMEETSPTETLGLPYAGSTAETETYNPGDEPA